MGLRIGYLIGKLKTGGSERQLSELAVGMVARGHAVQVVCYDGPGVFDEFVQAGGVKLVLMKGGSKLGKIRAIRDWIREFQPNVIHGFMKRASTLAVLANLPERACKVVASDYSTASYSRHKWDLWVSLLLWSLADRVSTQTEMNRSSLCLLAPWLHRKVVIVRNGVETARFVPARDRLLDDRFHFLVVGTVYKLKNPVRLVEAVRLLKENQSRPFMVRWVGHTGYASKETEEYHAAAALLARYGLDKVMSFTGPATCMEEEYRWADCLVHASLQEGMPNAVIEAMACGLPVIVSRVSDLPLVVSAGDNGFVCNERDPVSIAHAMAAALALTDDDRIAMGKRSRELAVSWFDRDRFVQQYEQLYMDILADLE